MGRSASIPSWKSAQCVMQRLREDRNWRDLLLFTVGCHTAYRVSDYRQIRWSWLTDKTEISIIEKKTDHLRKAARTVYFGKKVIETILECKEHLNSGSLDKFVFRPRRSKTSMAAPMTTRGINKALKIIAARYPECGLPADISSHSLRKCFAVNAYETMGKDQHALEFVSMLLGHKSTTVTRVYIGLDKQAIKSFYESL